MTSPATKKTVSSKNFMVIVLLATFIMFSCKQVVLFFVYGFVWRLSAAVHANPKVNIKSHSHSSGQRAY